MKFSELAYPDDWTSEPYFLDFGDGDISVCPEEYNWLLKGDPQPFINHLKENPEKMSINWVQSVLFESLKTSPKYRRSRPALESTAIRNEKIIESILIYLGKGENQTTSLKLSGDDHYLSYDSVRDIYKEARKTKLKLYGVLLQLVENRKIPTEKISQVAKVVFK